MTLQKIEMERFSVVSAKPFEVVVAKLEAAIGHPDMNAFLRGLTAAKTLADVGTVVSQAVGSTGLMEFTRFDIGEVMRKERGDAPKTLRLVIGNPLIMKQMVEHVPDAASYAPLTVLIDEREDAVHLSYDRMASLLASYGSAEALAVARELDSKIESLLTRAAA
jgi:uncharacterized protein (DUF302 family)